MSEAVLSLCLVLCIPNNKTYKNCQAELEMKTTGIIQATVLFKQKLSVLWLTSEQLSLHKRRMYMAT